MMGSLGTARNLGNSNILIAIASALGSVLWDRYWAVVQYHYYISPSHWIWYIHFLVVSKQLQHFLVKNKIWLLLLHA